MIVTIKDRTNTSSLPTIFTVKHVWHDDEYGWIYLENEGLGTYIIEEPDFEKAKEIYKSLINALPNCPIYVNLEQYKCYNLDDAKLLGMVGKGKG